MSTDSQYGLNAVSAQSQSATSRWNITRIFQYLPQIMSVVAVIEQLGSSGSGSGADKKKAAVAAIAAVLQTSEGIVVAHNPAYGAVIADLVDFVVRQMNAWLDLSQKQVSPTTTPTPTPIGSTGPGDYTAARYTSLDAAIAARSALPTPDVAVVYSLPDGSFQLWPKGINFFGSGTQVYP